MILLNETKDGCSHIKICEQPDQPSTISMLKNICLKNNNTKITHLFYLNNSKVINRNKHLYNLTYLSNITPFFTNNCNYTPYYYYSHIESINSFASFFSNVIITPNYIITYTVDHQYAMIYTDSNTYNGYNHLFYSYLQSSHQFVQSYDYQEYCQYCINNTFNDINIHTYSFNTSLCPTFILEENETFSENHIKNNFPNKEIFIKFYHNFLYSYKTISSQKKHQSIELFTKQGLLYFAKEGMLSEIYPDLWIPLSPKERISFLEKWKTLIQLNNYPYMLDIPNHPGDSLMNIYCSPTSCTLIAPKFDGSLLFLNIKEPSLTTVFYDFTEYIYNHNLCTKEDTLLFIDKLIEDLKSK